jgi:outer membrane immunogenic protein
MLRRILLASAGAMALAGTAFAAEPAPTPPPVYVPPPPMWTGFYIGANAGYEWAASRSVQTTTVPAFAAPTWATERALSSALATGTAFVNPNGFIGGGQIGYNYQFANSWFANSWLANNLVVGIEADFQGIAGSNRSGSFSGSGVPVGFPAETINSFVISTKKLDYLGTVRGRVGFLLMPTLLVYGTGGLAYGDTNPSTSIFQANLPFAPQFASFGSLSNTRVGWTAGGGFEWMFLPNWSAKVEYLYYDLGTVTYGLGPLAFSHIDRSLTISGGGPLQFSSASFSSTRFNGNVVRAGINYHFNWFGPAPVVAKY